MAQRDLTEPRCVVPTADPHPNQPTTATRRKFFFLKTGTNYAYGGWWHCGTGKCTTPCKSSKMQLDVGQYNQ